MAKNGIHVPMGEVVGGLGPEAGTFFGHSTPSITGHIKILPKEKGSDTITVSLSPQFGVIAASLSGKSLLDLEKEIAAAVASGGGPAWAIRHDQKPGPQASLNFPATLKILENDRYSGTKSD